MDNAPLLDIGLILTASSVAVGLVLGVIGFVENRRFQRRNLTVSLISNFMLNSDLSAADFFMTRQINTGKRFGDGAVSDEDDNHLITLLDYYEFLATAYQEGALDKQTILHTRGGPMARAFDVCAGYVRDRRQQLEAPNLYRNYENLVRDFRQAQLGL